MTHPSDIHSHLFRAAFPSSSFVDGTLSYRWSRATERATEPPRQSVESFTAFKTNPWLSRKDGAYLATHEKRLTGFIRQSYTMTFMNEHDYVATLLYPYVDEHHCQAAALEKLMANATEFLIDAKSIELPNTANIEVIMLAREEDFKPIRWYQQKGGILRFTVNNGEIHENKPSAWAGRIAENYSWLPKGWKALFALRPFKSTTNEFDVSEDIRWLHWKSVAATHFPTQFENHPSYRVKLRIDGHTKEFNQVLAACDGMWIEPLGSIGSFKFEEIESYSMI